MKLYYAPGACSIGIHVLLEEIGKPYQTEPVNLRDGAQFKPLSQGSTQKRRFRLSSATMARSSPSSR
jgi:hypothetical protein